MQPGAGGGTTLAEFARHDQPGRNTWGAKVYSTAGGVYWSRKECKVGQVTIDGSNSCDCNNFFLRVRDVVEEFLALFAYNRSGSAVFFLGQIKGCSVRDVLNGDLRQLRTQARRKGALDNRALLQV